MRRARPLLLAIAVALLATGPLRAAPPIELDLKVTIDPARHRLQATAAVTLPAGRSARLRLAPTFTVEGDDVTQASGEIRIAGERDRRRHVRFRYAGTLPDLDPRRPQSGIGPAGSYLPPGGGWYPAPADGSGLRYRLEVDVPADRRAVASGALVTETVSDEGYRASFVSEAPGPGPVLLEGPLEITERQTAGIRLRTYFPPELADLTDIYLENAGRYLAHYSREIGNYPYDAFHVVAAPLPVGLGFTNLTYMSERILGRDFAQTRSLAHEVLHNWWGGAVDVDYRHGNWAEGLTTYMADYALAGPPGSRARHEMRLEWLRSYAALPADRERALADFDFKRHDAAQVVGYDKAAFVFHMLWRRLGEGAFRVGMQRFWQQNQGRAASWDDLRTAAEQVSGLPLADIFRQWVARPGAPELRLGEIEVSGNGDGGFVTHVTLAQKAPAYDLRVPVRVETAAGGAETIVALNGTMAEAEITTADRPTHLTVDPAHHVFRRLHPEEVPPILRDVTLAPEAALIVTGGSRNFQAAAKALATHLMDVAAPTMLPPDAAASTTDLPLILVGPPTAVTDWRQRHGVAGPPAPITGLGDARVWAARLDDGRAVVLIAATDAAAVTALQRPLPHYGRRGYVAFERGRAVAQGVAAPAGGPLQRPLSATPAR